MLSIGADLDWKVLLADWNAPLLLSERSCFRLPPTLSQSSLSVGTGHHDRLWHVRHT